MVEKRELPKLEENRRVLVVDDEPEIREGYKLILGPKKTESSAVVSSRTKVPPKTETASERQALGYDLTDASSGEAALEILKREYSEGRQFAGAIVDVRMPGKIDGLQFIQKAWAIDPDLVVVVVTAYQDRSVDEIDRLFGIQYQDQWSYLNKPFTSGEILQKTRQIVSIWNRRNAEKTYIQQIEIQQKALIAQEQIAVVGRLARNIGHDLGNILQQIMSKIEVLPNAKELEEILEEVELGAKICQDLLLFSRQYKEIEEPQLIEVGVIAQKALRLLRQEMKKKDIQLKTNIAERVSIRGHQQRLVQVFLNLMTNAIQAMKPGGTLSVSTLFSGPDKKEVIITVSDTGEGISPENLNRMFEPLFTTKGSSGNGLGLTVCKTVVESYGGKISIDSQLGKGTTVRLTFTL